jgi:hypothetical protein
MTNRDSNFDSIGGPQGNTADSAGVPAALAGIPEEVLLGWIEGELPAAQVSQLVAQHPDAAGFISAMKRDRAGLAGLEHVPAPADLADHVLAAVEREALIGLSQGELVSDSLPISKVPKRRTARQDWWQQATPRMALAAGLTLVVSAGAILAMRGRTKPNSPIGPIAIVGPEQDDPAASSRSAFATPSDVDTTAPGADAGVMNEATSMKVTTAAAGASPELALDSARAAALAGEGRLVLRVRGVTTAAADRLATARARVSPMWQVRGELEPTTVAMLAPTAAPGTAAESQDFMPMIASMMTSNGASESGPRSMNPMMVVPMPDSLPMGAMHRGNIVDVREDPASLEAARAALSKLLGAAVEFEELDQPMALESEQPSAESVLWWTQPPETWAKRVRVPLVVELK